MYMYSPPLSFLYRKRPHSKYFFIPCFFHLTMYPGNHSVSGYRDLCIFKQVHSIHYANVSQAFRPLSDAWVFITDNAEVTCQCIYVVSLEAYLQGWFGKVGLLGWGKTHDILLAMINFPSMGGLYYFVLPPAMYENAWLGRRGRS